MRTQPEFWVLYVKRDTKEAGGARGRGPEGARLDITQRAKGGGGFNLEENVVWWVHCPQRTFLEMRNGFTL